MVLGKFLGTFLLIIVFLELIASLLRWNLHINNPARRMVVVSYAWCVFLFTSIMVYSVYLKSDDIGAAFGLMGILLLPLILPLVWVFDRYLCNTNYFKKCYKIITALDFIFAISLYIPVTMLFVFTFSIVSKYA